MATQTPTFESSAGGAIPREEARPDFGSLLNSILIPFASLKLTVVLFALSILIVLFGTLAQATADIWTVIDQYFRVDFTRLFSASFPWFHPGQFFVKVPFQIFFPPAFTRIPWQVSGWFPFPKGWLIGLFMAVNLLAAHTVRFKMQSHGTRLLSGLLVLAFGVLVTWAVIVSGSNKHGVQTDYAVQWSTLWHGMQISLIGLMLSMGYGLFAVDPTKKWHRYLLILGLALALPLLIWMFWYGSAIPIDDSGMRILWQLVKGTLAGVILLIGCILVFKKRAGIVLLHGGIGLMMFYEVLVGVAADEGQMTIVEGETVNFTRDIREPELAIAKPLNDDQDEVTVIPYRILKKHLPSTSSGESQQTPGGIISDERLPFDLRIDEYYVNNKLVAASGSDQEKVTGGAGKARRPEPLAAAIGAGSDQNVDQPAAYVSFFEKGKHDQPISVNLLALQLGSSDQPETVQVGDQSYNVFLRFKRNYKPYSVTLKDVSKEDYEGTMIPRDYSSHIVLVDDQNNNQLEARVWMNNPLRYGGETFYQSGYIPLGDGVEATTLSVVTNTGWMIPYVSCMIVVVGMLAQFLMTLTRFLNRRAGKPVQPDQGEAAEPIFDSEPSLGRKQSPAALWLPLAIALVVCVYLGGKMMVHKPAADEMNLYTVGQIPVRDDGRLKPLDTFARNTLRLLSRKVEFEDVNEEKQPAIRFLLDVMTPVESEANKNAAAPVMMRTRADAHRVFYIENLDAQEFLDLEKRKGFLYSYQELEPKLEELVAHLQKLEEEKAAAEARRNEGGESESQERETIEEQYASLMNLKLRELFQKVQRYRGLKESFIPLPVTADMVPSTEALFTNPRESVQRFLDLRTLQSSYPEHLEEAKAPLLIPVMNSLKDGDDPEYAGRWEAYPWGYVQEEIDPGLYKISKLLHERGLLQEEPEAPPEQPNPLISQFTKIREAYAKNDPQKFNKAVAGYLGFLGSSPPSDLDLSRIFYERYFNAASIYYYAAVVSLFAFILGLGSWIGWSEPLRRASFWIILVLLIVHTYGIVSRIYISGRPPVTNLYSSAIFIGWGAIALGLLLEWLYPIGIAVVISSALSFGTLLIAYFLSIGGDTIGVLQAVLDTQFWLATHVVCITLGYATTFVAGFLGLAYFLRGTLTPTLTKPLARDLTRMIYGILCFAIFFSFWGTVLGGLWADDSWGRFWGWDPKENGALIIVLWNALVLHARWGGLVKDRGLAILAMGGNIVTSWSWFGVNELGVGLHSYGFTDGVLRSLAIFFFIQIAIIAIASAIPQKEWWSFRRQRLEASR